ncbi:hypothetical protein IV102_28265 [bacterium]|nr:hypothetical protein [bacterium]
MSRPLKQLTIRNFEPELIEALEKLAQQQSLSLNQAALLLMRRGAGTGKRGRPKIGGALDRFIGTMTSLEEREFLQATEGCRQIDPEFWR